MKKFKLVLISLIICFVLIGCQRKITDEDINKIVEKKNITEITWEDFAGFKYQEDKYQDLVRIYAIDNGSSLILSGSIDSDRPSIISIVEINGNITYLKNENATK